MCWGRARGLVYSGEGQSRISDPSSPSLLPHPALSWDVSAGDGFPGNRSPGEEAASCTLRVMQNGLLKVARGGGAQSDIGWNGDTSYISKLNNFQPLHTTWLCFFFSLLANQH